MYEVVVAAVAVEVDTSVTLWVISENEGMNSKFVSFVQEIIERNVLIEGDKRL